ncbi:CG5793 [Drosophila busckii]|uniref:CG5793 n=2 Tax=Drosophila busckii TaxID=30019 RepID=A0A0M4EM43_DROBS|nr:CG5793 [Drosophila busckii]
MGQDNSKPSTYEEDKNGGKDYKKAKIGAISIYDNVVPKWIHRNVFLEILTEHIPNFKRIKKFRVGLANSDDENYSSLLLRVRIKVELTDETIEHLSFILKVPHESAEMQQMLKTVNFFDIENATYTDLISKFQSFYEDLGLDIVFAPKHYRFKTGLENEPKLANTVLMEDLCEQGYANLNRLECVNFEQTKMVLQKLAQYHAAGAQCRVVNGPYSSIYTQEMFDANEDRCLFILNGIMGPFMSMFLETLKSYKNGDIYYDKFLTISANLSKRFFTLSKYDPEEFNVINHGDCFVNNLLFKFGTEDKLIDVRFVDFQLPRYGHPSIDLFNFILTSVHIDYKLKQFDYFIKYYHDQLIKHLQLFEYKEYIPSLKELHMELYKYGIYAITASVMVLPVVLMEPREEESIDGKQFKDLLYTNSRYRAYIEEILPWLDNRGLLDM